MGLTQVDDRGLKTPIDLLDDEKIRLGTGNDLEIYHNGSNSIIDSNTGNLEITSDSFYVNNAANNEVLIKAVADGQVELYYDNSKKFETTSAGTKNTGVIDCTGSILLADQSGNDIGKLRLGNSQDLEIYHDGSDSFIRDLGTGALKITSNLFRVNNADNSEAMIKAEENAGVTLSYDGSTKFETTTAGISVTGAVYSSTGVVGEDASNHFDFVTDNRIAVSINGSEEFRFESDGDFHADGDVIAYSTTISSDEKLKENIKIVPDSLDKIEALRGVTFDWKRDGKSSAGVIAQDVMGVLPEAVKEVQGLNDKESYLSVNYHALTSILIEAIKDLSAKIKVLEAK